jgi:hypothetical protein
MMKNIRLTGVISLLILITVIGCKRTLYNHPDDTLTHYYLPLKEGKYAVYQVDSLNFYYYGQLDTVTHYLVKDSVENSFTDNLGQVSYTVVRYITPASGPANWAASETNVVTPSARSIELSENNLRFIKLAYPLKDGLTWNGNSYLPRDPYGDIFDYIAPENVDINQWTYTYQHVNQSFNTGSVNYDSTVTILQQDDSFNVPILIDTSVAHRTYWSETYARNIGLVYRHSILWEYQPPIPNTTQGGYKIGFEVTFTLLEHN